MPRVVLAPIFAVWFGLGIWSKVALGVTLVFFVVFFNVYQGVREVSPTLLANARMLGASRRQLLRSIYLPSAMSWVFASLHNAVGLAFVGAVVGEYLGSAQRRRLPDPAGRGHVRHQHRVRRHPRADGFRAGARRRGRRRRAAPDDLAAARRARPRRSDAVTSGEPRRPLLEEVGDALLEVGGLEGQLHLVVGLDRRLGERLELRPPRAGASSPRPSAARRCRRAAGHRPGVSAISLSSGMTRLTRPSDSASGARNLRAEHSRSSAAGRPTSRGSSQLTPCSAIRPRWAKAVVNTADSAANRRSA